MPIDGQEKSPGWGRVPRWTLGKLAFSRSAAAVYLVLATHVSRDWLAWPSVKTIMDFAGLERRTVQRALHNLVHRKILAIERPGGGRSADGKGIPTVYRLLTDSKGATTDAVKSAPRCAVKGAVAERATAQKRAKKGAPRCAQTDNRTDEAATEAAGAAAAVGSAEEAEVIETLCAAGIGNPARSRLAQTMGVTVGLIESEVSRLDGTGKGAPILIENITSAAAKLIADEERRTQERAQADAQSQATRAKLDRLAAANASAKGLIETLSGDQLADLHRQVLKSCPPLKREIWERADPRAHPDLMREIARVARKSTRKVSA